MNLSFLDSETSEDARAALQAAVRIIKQVGIFRGGKKKFVEASNLVAINQSQNNMLSKIIAEVEIQHGKKIADMNETEAIKALNHLTELERELGPQKSNKGQKLADDFLARLSEGKL